MLAKTTGTSPRYSGRAGSAALPRHGFNFIGRFDGTWLFQRNLPGLGQTVRASRRVSIWCRNGVSPFMLRESRANETAPRNFVQLSSRYRLGKAVREARTERTRQSGSSRLNESAISSWLKDNELSMLVQCSFNFKSMNLLLYHNPLPTNEVLSIIYAHAIDELCSLNCCRLL
jgi:hypothetical protein